MRRMRWFFTMLIVPLACQGDDKGFGSERLDDTAEPIEVTDIGDAGDVNPGQALTCPDQAFVSRSLREKAERFDALGRKWHLPAGQNLWYSVFLKEDLETFDRIDMSDNVGMWTATYAASQSFRYAVTRDPEALENLRRVIRGEHDLVRVTGVRGLFTRVMIDPTLPGFPSAEQLASWYPDCDLAVKHCKRYVEVTEGEYRGLWFKTDVSKDEYSGHLLSMATAWEFVDDPEVRERVRDIVLAVGDHLIEHGLRITDIDGRVTTFGHLNALALDDFPGFNAILALAWMRLAATVGGGKYLDFYQSCLLQAAGEKECIPGEPPMPYTFYLDSVGLNLDCKTNWNNHGMAQFGMWALLRFEDDPLLKRTYQKALREQLWDADDPRPMRAQHNTLWTFFYLINRDPDDPWPEEEATTALCVLYRFPDSKHHRAIDNLSKYRQVCTDRSGDPMTDVVIPIDDTGMDNFLWFRNPYEMERDEEDLRHVESPEDFLLAYWFGRYFGLIAPDA